MIKMPLHQIPVTAFPWLKQLSINHSPTEGELFDSYIELCEFVQTVISLRAQSLSGLRDVSLSEESDYVSLVSKISSESYSNWACHHRAVYQLFYLGAYKEAHLLQESNFKYNNPIYFDRYSDLLNSLPLSEACDTINTLLSSLTHDSTIIHFNHLRIKSISSIFSKSLFLGEYNILQSPCNFSYRIDNNILPYDSIGVRILLELQDNKLYSELINNITSHFKDNGIKLRDQNIYSPPWMNRKSLTGRVVINNNSIPFQVQIWDIRANNYELMTYGNYKLERISCPPYANWRKYLLRGVSLFEHSLMSIGQLSLQIL